MLLPFASRPAVAASVAIALLLAAGQTWGAPADQRSVKAKKACAAGRVEEGVDLLAEMFAETGDLNYVYNQGRCYQQNGYAEKALNRFREYLRRVNGISADDRHEVEHFIEELEGQREKRPPTGGTTGEGPGMKRLTTVGLGLGVVGALSVGAAIVLTMKVRSFEREVEGYVRSQDVVDPQVLAGKMREGARLETFQWVAYGFGVAALAGGATCYLLGLDRGGGAPGGLGVGAGPTGPRLLDLDQGEALISR